MRWVLVLAAALAPTFAFAARFEGTVTHVSDGDTLSVRPLAGGPPQRIRIQGIDAPEICQPFGTHAREALAARVMGKRVQVDARAQDNYQRTIGRIHLGHEDLGAWMVGHGYAWSNRFHRSPGPYRRQEAQARQARLGLWKSDRPQLPREFRARHGSCY